MLAIIAAGCKTGDKFVPQNAEEAFSEGKRLYDKKEYSEAMSYFDMMKLQYPSSPFGAEAQYYIAEINFAREEYVLASFNYSRVRGLYPGSDLAKIAMYKAGYSQFLMAPDYHKDQEHTKKAIKSLQEYQSFYPDRDSLYTRADSMIYELRNRLGEKSYQTAELYAKLESYKSALIYYNDVIKDYDDTKYFEDAWYGKIAMLKTLKMDEEAKNAEMNYNNLFPNGKYKTQIKQLKSNEVR